MSERVKVGEVDLALSDVEDVSFELGDRFERLGTVIITEKNGNTHQVHEVAEVTAGKLREKLWSTEETTTESEDSEEADL